MNIRTILPALTLALLLAACGGKSAEDYTLDEWERLDKTERQEKVRELGEEDASLLMLGALEMGMSGDTLRSGKMTVREVIERGKEVRERELEKAE